MSPRDPRITIGRHTYGLKSANCLLFQPDERIEVGSFCSFAWEVALFGGGEHLVGVSTYPLRTKLLEPKRGNVEAMSKGPLRIGNDCWFGFRSMVLSGLTVGHGAIVAAGAVVTSDVPPYAVVAGNPARVIRMRFDDRTIERLLEIAWWDWDDETIRRRGHLFADVEAFLRAAEEGMLDEPPAEPPPRPPVPRAPADLYVTTLRQALVGLLHRDGPRAAEDLEARRTGRDWPADADTMVGVERLDNVRRCVEDVIARRVPGDLIETGVWRGGTTIFMRGILAAHGIRDRRVWVADSFRGLPPPDPAHPLDEESRLHEEPFLAVPEDEVRANFARYGLLDDQVRFVSGWFRDTLPALRDERFAVVRLDGDMYESTMVALEHLYPRLSVGGYLIVDDYGLRSCRRAVDDYRARHGIEEKIERVDWTGAY